MKNQKLRPIAFALVLLLVGTLLAVPLVVAAREWWIMEVTYTMQGRKPESITGTRSRIYIPKVTAALSDGIEMEVKYEISKNGEVLVEALYHEGAFYDLHGAGTYVFTYMGVDAANTYSFEVVADDTYPSIILERDLATKAYTDEALNVPSAKIIWKDTELEAAVRLITANSEQYSPADKVVPKSGRLRVEYTANIEAIDHQFVYELDVLDRDIGFYDDSGNFYPAGTHPYEHMDLAGCVLDDPTCLTYTFSETIDLSASSKDIPLIVLNNAAQTECRTTPKVKIVDAHNSQNYIEIIGRWSADNDTVVYSVAKAPNQQLGGMSGGAFYTQSTFGSLTTFPTSSRATKTPATYYYDAAENAAYVNWYGQINLINDFDAEYQMSPWKGFTTGEVYIVVERSSATDFICVESVAGHSLASYDCDYNAPSINVAAEDISNIPTAVVDKDYPIFEAKAFDLMDSAVPVTIRVFKGYDASDGIEVPVINGVFVPYEAGYYTISYTAQDRFSNVGTVHVNVLAVNEKDTLPMEAQIKAPMQEAFVGEEILIYEPENITGGNGPVNYTVYMVAPDGTEEKITGNVGTISGEGTNMLRYVLKDYLGITKEYSFEIQATASPNPILHELVMPSTICSGKTFTLPEVRYASDSAVEITVEATLNGQSVDIVNGTVTPIAEKSGDELVITYRARSSTGSSEKSYIITVLRGDISDRTTYFVPDRGSFSIEQDKDSIRFTTQESFASVCFANSVLADKFKVAFSVDPEQNDSDMISVLLTDSLNPNISVKLDIVKQENGDANSSSDLYINGIRTNGMAGNFYGGSESLQLCYNAKSFGITDALGAAAGTISKTANGEPFSGFPSGEINITISAGTVGEGGFSFSLLQINNQNFYDDEMFFDTYAEMILRGQLELQTNLGSTLEIPPAVAGDVLSPSASVMVSIRKDNDVVLEKQAATEPIAYSFDEYGVYNVIYTYSDGINSRSASYNVRTIEHTPPEVGELGKMPSQAKVGDVISVIAPGANDDFTQDATVSIFVRTPSSTLLRLTSDNMSFKTERAGIYTIMFYAYDECFNYQVVTHTIEVVEQNEQQK